jgi:hypothetical protein
MRGLSDRQIAIDRQPRNTDAWQQLTNTAREERPLNLSLGCEKSWHLAEIHR